MTDSDEMWNEVEWLMPVDIAILSLLSIQKDLEMTPGNIARNVNYDPSYIAERGRFLSEVGLLNKSENGTNPYYSTTDIGKAVVNREIDPEKVRGMADDDLDGE